MTCTEEYKEHIEYTFHAFCKIVIRNASYTALRTWSRKHKREISLDYITDEKHYPLGTTDEYFKAPGRGIHRPSLRRYRYPKQWAAGTSPLPSTSAEAGNALSVLFQAYAAA